MCPRPFGRMPSAPKISVSRPRTAVWIAGADEALAGHLVAPSFPAFMRAAIATMVAFIRLTRGSG